jgi:hypothetical protein
VTLSVEMAKTSHHRTVQGRVDAPLDWAEIASFFDACFGLQRRALPRFPQALGTIYARWQEVDGIIHEAQSLEELERAYHDRVTFQIEFGSVGLPDPPEQMDFSYRPGVGDATLTVTTSSQRTLEDLVSAFSQLFPLPIGCVFVSYDTRELPIAEFLKNLLERRLGPGVPVFVAKRDIRVGDDPTKKMITESLLRATAILSICTPLSKTSPWLWWETATVWARNQLVIPLFADISPRDFDGPINVLLQGRQLFDRAELMDAIGEVMRRIVPSRDIEELTESEQKEYDALRRKKGGKGDERPQPHN